MKGPAIDYIAQIMFCCLSLVGVHKREERLADESFRLIFKVTGKNGVEVDKLQVGRQERPI